MCELFVRLSCLHLYLHGETHAHLYAHTRIDRQINIIRRHLHTLKQAHIRTPTITETNKNKIHIQIEIELLEFLQ